MQKKAVKEARGTKKAEGKWYRWNSDSPHRKERHQKR